MITDLSNSVPHTPIISPPSNNNTTLYLHAFNLNGIDNPTELFYRKLNEAAFQYIDIETLYDDIMAGKNLVLQGYIDNDFGYFGHNSFGCDSPVIQYSTIVPNSISVFRGLFYTGPYTAVVSIKLLSAGINYGFSTLIAPIGNQDYGFDAYKSYTGRLLYTVATTQY